MLRCKFILSILLYFVSGCSLVENQREIIVILPQVVRSFELKKMMSYAESIILGEVSLQLAYVDDDLSFKSDIIESFHSKDFKSYNVKLNKSYRSGRGEIIDANDIVFSIKNQLVGQNTGVYTDLLKIEGGDECKSLNCDIPGLSIVNDFEVRINFQSPNKNFLELISSVGRLVIKKNKPKHETIGDCMVPYMTGRSQVVECTVEFIRIKQGEHIFKIYSEDKAKELGISGKRIVSEKKTTEENYSSLSNLSFYFLPSSFLMKNKNNRLNVFEFLECTKDKLLEIIRLNPSESVSPKWFSIAIEKSKISKCQNIKLDKKIKIIIDSTVPYSAEVKKKLSSLSGELISAEVLSAPEATTKLKDFDIWLAWFSPSYLSVYDLLSVLDCSSGGACFFSWQDNFLNKKLETMRLLSESGETPLKIAQEVESHILNENYILPLGVMNWWISDGNNTKPVHPAGLPNIKLKDFIF